VIDAPCTGTGTWRRQPTAKWKLTPRNSPPALPSSTRCSSGPCRSSSPAAPSPISPARYCPRNGGQVAGFAAHPEFEAVPANTLWMAHYSARNCAPAFRPKAACHARHYRHRWLLHRATAPQGLRRGANLAAALIARPSLRRSNPTWGLCVKLPSSSSSAPASSEPRSRPAGPGLCWSSSWPSSSGSGL